MRYLYLTFILLAIVSCSNSKNKAVDSKETTASQEKDSQSEADVIENDVAEVYYFHGDRRCATCRAVGRIAKEYTKSQFENEINEGMVKIIEVNYDEPGNEELVQKLKVSRSSLIIRRVQNNQEEVINLTDVAFMNARNNPDKVREAIKNEIDPVVNL